jgi:hypothetical protein
MDGSGTTWPNRHRVRARVTMVWIETTTGAVNERYLVRIERTTHGTVLHLVNGQTVKTPLAFDVVDGRLVVAEPDDDDSDVPF